MTEINSDLESQIDNRKKKLLDWRNTGDAYSNKFRPKKVDGNGCI